MNGPSSITNPAGATGFRPWRFWGAVALACVGILAISTLLSGHLSKRFRTRGGSPERFHVLSQDLEAVERTGKLVRMSDLRGKVHTIVYLYTVCPHGCAAVMSEMLKLQESHGARSDFHQVSVSVLPDRDTADMLAAYAKGVSLEESAPWWFLTGEQKPLWDYMTGELKLEPALPIPPEEQLNPLDTHSHDLRIVLVDRSGRVRGYYAVFHPQAEISTLMRQRLHADVQTLLDERNP